MKKIVFRKFNLLLILNLLIFSCIFCSDTKALQVENRINNLYTSQDARTRDVSSKLYGVVGKSQLLKFDQNVSRISITDPALADLVIISPKELLLNGKKAGRTSLIFWGENNNPIFYNLIINQDSDAFVQSVSDIVGDDNVKLTFTQDGAILSGKVSTTAKREKIKELAKAHKINLTDLAESTTKQVLLEVKIAEASRTFTRDLSTKFSVGSTYSSLNSAGSSGNAAFDPVDGLKYLYINAKSKLAFEIDAAESEGLVKILAEPKLLTMNGEKGSFNVGQEVPVPSQVGQYGNVSYQFKNTGVILNYTPQILDESKRIVLKLSPEISEIDASISGTVPGFKTRKVDTTVELADGETLMIAGLLSNSTAKTKDKVPFLGNIPGLGFFFSGTSHDKREIELLIFITPKIVEFDSDSDRIDL